MCPLLPARLGYWLFARFGDLVFFLTAKKQTTYFNNLRRVLGPQAGPAQVNRIAQSAFQNLLKNYFDLFRWHRITKDELRQQLAGLHGFEYLEDALKQGKGVIAGSGHFGAWDLVINLAAVYLETAIVVPNERIKPERLFQYILALRRSQGIDMVATRRCSARLDQGTSRQATGRPRLRPRHYQDRPGRGFFRISDSDARWRCSIVAQVRRTRHYRFFSQAAGQSQRRLHRTAARIRKNR